MWNCTTVFSVSTLKMEAVISSEKFVQINKNGAHFHNPEDYYVNLQPPQPPIEGSFLK